MNRNNLSLISQPAWKVLAVDFVARMLGVLVHVEGVPLGKPTFYRPTEAKTWGL
jgi:hypothetical protein